MLKIISGMSSAIFHSQTACSGLGLSGTGRLVTNGEGLAQKDPVRSTDPAVF
jgi:hypothetical protein